MATNNNVALDESIQLSNFLSEDQCLSYTLNFITLRLAGPVLDLHQSLLSRTVLPGAMNVNRRMFFTTIGGKQGASSLCQVLVTPGGLRLNSPTRIVQVHPTH
jgi:hypothetical protein